MTDLNETCNIELAVETSQQDNSLDSLVPLSMFSPTTNETCQLTTQCPSPCSQQNVQNCTLQNSIQQTEQGFTIIDGVMYNRAGYEICGVKNQHNRPCQRIGFCPFHGKKKQNNQQGNQSAIEKKKVNEKTASLKKQPFKQGWTKEEHLRFLTGLQIHGKGAWKDIAAIVATRTATQIQSHAQKYFLRQRQKVKNKRSIHDFTIEDLQKAVAAEAAARQKQQQQQQQQQQQPQKVQTTPIQNLDPATMQFATAQEWKKCAEFLQALQAEQAIAPQMRLPYTQFFADLDPINQWKPLMGNAFGTLDTTGLINSYPTNHQRLDLPIVQQNLQYVHNTKVTGNPIQQVSTTELNQQSKVSGQKRKLEQNTFDFIDEPLLKKSFTSTLYRE
jgi:SHAQKYF class myb-like DNA-binding protein